MAQNKSQLPMIRSLKTIARRRSTEWPEIPDAVRDQLAEAVKARQQHLQAEWRRFISRAPVATVRAAVMHSYGVAPPPHLKAAMLEFGEDMKRIKASIESTVIDSTRWKKDQVAMYKKLFNDLENIELQIIAGEEVDLAPYARQLQN